MNFIDYLITSLSLLQLKKVQERLSPKLSEVLVEKKLDMVFVMLTDVLDESSHMIFAGDDAKETMIQAFGLKTEENNFYLPGVVSRKKQLIPRIMNALAEKI